MRACAITLVLLVAPTVLASEDPCALLEKDVDRLQCYDMEARLWKKIEGDSERAAQLAAEKVEERRALRAKIRAIKERRRGNLIRGHGLRVVGGIFLGSGIYTAGSGPVLLAVSDSYGDIYHTYGIINIGVDIALGIAGGALIGGGNQELRVAKKLRHRLYRLDDLERSLD